MPPLRFFAGLGDVTRLSFLNFASPSWLRVLTQPPRWLYTLFALFALALFGLLMYGWSSPATKTGTNLPTRRCVSAQEPSINFLHNPETSCAYKPLCGKSRSPISPHHRNEHPHVGREERTAGAPQREEHLGTSNNCR
jgi:hypothetical protein